MHDDTIDPGNPGGTFGALPWSPPAAADRSQPPFGGFTAPSALSAPRGPMPEASARSVASAAPPAASADIGRFAPVQSEPPTAPPIDLPPPPFLKADLPPALGEATPVDLSTVPPPAFEALIDQAPAADAPPHSSAKPLGFASASGPVEAHDDFAVPGLLGFASPPSAAARDGRRSAPSNADPDLLWALGQVVRQGASDLHLAVGSMPRIRLHGALQDLPSTVPWTAEKMRSALHSIMAPHLREVFDETLELDFAFTLSSESRFRVNVYQQRGLMGAAFRLIPTEIKSLEDLGVPPSVGRFAALPRGLVLVTGPTGSGKSTTLAALIDLVNRTRADHVVTVEDPIEFMHENKKSLINQREVGGDTHSFANALKHVLRQDPDVILIGELRDLETISVALTAAETGHLVFATLHTQSAGQTIDRIIDVFPPHQQGQVRAQLAATLQGVVCQTLIPRASGTGRAVATEILVANPAIANLIREGKTFQIPSALQAGRELGMHTLDQHLADLVNQGVITHHAALEKAQDTESLRQLIHRTESSGSSIDFRGAF